MLLPSAEDGINTFDFHLTVEMGKTGYRRYKKCFCAFKASYTLMKSQGQNILTKYI